MDKKTLTKRNDDFWFWNMNDNCLKQLVICISYLLLSIMLLRYELPPIHCSNWWKINEVNWNKGCKQWLLFCNKNVQWTTDAFLLEHTVCHTAGFAI